MKLPAKGEPPSFLTLCVFVVMALSPLARHAAGPRRSTLVADERLLPIDNNEVEHLMKQVAVGRKNWLFIASVAAGVRAAALMTLLSSALRNELDVWYT